MQINNLDNRLLFNTMPVVQILRKTYRSINMVVTQNCTSWSLYLNVELLYLHTVCYANLRNSNH